ncbi:MAG: chitobiase/beta-hexosaminidase C-terminal domain-containing protein [Lachnotalea sp.]
MVCTKCGAELQEADLFCLNCGQEVQMVPDYNPVEEMVIRNLAEAQQSQMILENFKKGHTTQDIITKQDPKYKENHKHDNENNYNKYQKHKRIVKRKECIKKANSKLHNLHSSNIKFKYVYIFLAILATIAISMVTIQYRHSHSYRYQYAQAQDAISNGDYDEAYSYLEKASALNNSDVKIKLLMVLVYQKLEKTDDAIILLKEILAIDTTNVDAAKRLIQLYSDLNMTDELIAYLDEIEKNPLPSALGEFYLNRPNFSVEGGVYDKYVSLEIASAENSDIYYTVDGTKPTTLAIKYSGQIRLRGGTTKIRAVSVNQSGDLSIETIEEYTVNSTVPENPVINPASGLYSSPLPISITIPNNCNVYYTLDGSEPTETSYLYTRPLDMPLGKFVLSVVAIDDNGIISNTIQCSYDLEITTRFSVDQAYDILVQRLGNQLVDETGAFQLECSSAIEIGGYNLYAFEKVYGTDSNGNKIAGADKYTFDVLTAETFHAVINSAGGYDLTPF